MVLQLLGAGRAPPQLRPSRSAGVECSVEPSSRTITISFNHIEVSLLGGLIFLDQLFRLAESTWTSASFGRPVHTFHTPRRAGLAYLVHLLALQYLLTSQYVFRGDMGNGVGERWDNNGGSNWSAVVELSPGQGLVTAPELDLASSSSQALVSSLLLR